MVRQGSAKPLFSGSNPEAASNFTDEFDEGRNCSAGMMNSWQAGSGVGDPGSAQPGELPSVQAVVAQHRVDGRALVELALAGSYR